MANQHDPIFLVAQKFASELRALHAKMSWGDWKSHNLVLRVTHDGQKTNFQLEWAGPGSEAYHPIKASNLGALMDEVYHRQGFHDRQEANIQNSMNLLEGPKEEREEEREREREI